MSVSIVCWSVHLTTNYLLSIKSFLLVSTTFYAEYLMLKYLFAFAFY